MGQEVRLTVLRRCFLGLSIFGGLVWLTIAFSAPRTVVKSKGNLSIHVVEDDESIRDSTCVLLETLGFQVQAFSSAVEYLDSKSIGAADCLLADVHMPHMTGVELLELLRSRGIKTPVIIMTGNGSHLKARVLRAGNCAILPKPFEESELLRKIADAL